MKAACYARVSTDEQAVHGYSLISQQDECVKYLVNHGYEDYEVFVDDGYSAKDMNRPALQRMLSEVKDKKIGMVVFWNTDRLTRDTIDGLLMCRDMFFKKGILFASITEKIDMTTADGEMMFTIRLSMAQAERRRIGERTRIGYSKRAQLGFRNSPARPYGYEIGENITLTVNEEEKNTVKMIFEWYIGGYGTTKIARELNILGIPGPRGGKWNHVAINHILQNLTYLGYNHWKPKDAPESERIIKKAGHDPILDDATFHQAQEIMRRRSNKEMSRSSRTFYFSTILKCAGCGSSFYGNISRKGNYSRNTYYCAGKRRVGICTVPTISEMKVTKMVLTEMDRFIKKTMDTSEEVTVTDKADVLKQRKQIEREIAKVNTELERLVKLYMANKVDLNVYEKARDETKARIVHLEQRLFSLPQVEEKKVTLAAAVKLVELIHENWPHLTDQERKTLVQRLYSKIKIAYINGTWRVEEMTSAL